MSGSAARVAGRWASMTTFIPTYTKTYEYTDRHRPPVALSAADVSHLYHIQISDLYAPIRTLDPEHRPTTVTSTSHTSSTYPNSPPYLRRCDWTLPRQPSGPSYPPSFEKPNYTSDPTRSMSATDAPSAAPPRASATYATAS